MSTHSRIGMEDPKTGKIISVYCHFDGYPEGVGTVLHYHYNDLDKIKQLMDLGDLSILGKHIGEKHDFDSHKDSDDCLAYGRDRGDKNVDALISDTVSDFLACGERYAYLYRNGEWLVNLNPHSNTQIWKRLALVVESVRVEE